MKMPRLHSLFLSLAGVVAVAAPVVATARLARIEIESTQPAPAVAGAQPYEILRGRFFGELDPADPRNALITDLASAPRNAGGKVEYSATFALARPVEARQASGVLFYDVPNRGGAAVAADPAGHVRVVSGWQADIPEEPGLQTLRAPVALGRGGRALTAPVLARFVDMPAGSRSLPLIGGYARPTLLPEPASLDPRKARLYTQSSPGAPLVPVAPRDWAFADCEREPFPGHPDPARVCLRSGFDPALAYTLVYTGKNPKVMGVGFAATRDLIAFLRRNASDDAGHPNPAREVRWAVASGTSQSGNYLKSYVHLGFNADEQGCIVFDGINPNIAARQVPLNLRFAIPGGAARPFEPGSEGTLWWSSYEDKARGRGTSSLLDRCTRSSTCPKVIETFGSAEFWGLRMSPGLTGTRADTDIPLPDSVRRYYFPGVTHGGSFTGGFPAAGDPVPPGCLLRGNPNPMQAEHRAALRRLVEWVKSGTAPPASRYPTLAAGDLVPPSPASLGWPTIPGSPTPDGKINRMPDQDFGRVARINDLSGMLPRLPPRMGSEIPQRVPRVDADGNELAGIRSVQLQVPLGTYLGWNVQATGFLRGEGCGFAGGYIPFARTRAERLASGDPRPSLEERYGSREGFVAHVRAAAEKHQAEGWLTAEDARTLVEQASATDAFAPANRPATDR